jgi:hypothetical protein
MAHGITMHKWEDNIKIDLREVGYEVTDRTHLAKG